MYFILIMRKNKHIIIHDSIMNTFKSELYCMYTKYLIH